MSAELAIQLLIRDKSTDGVLFIMLENDEEMA